MPKRNQNKAPSKLDVKAFLINQGWSHKYAGELVGITTRCVQMYTGGESVIPYAVWFTWHVKAGLTPKMKPWSKRR